MLSLLDDLHARARAQPLLYRVVLATRCLFAMAFVPTGAVKLAGARFSQISTDHPIGAFFEAMYQTGGYWQFLGATQVVAGLLLLIPRTATLGAVIFFPIVVNILVITVALDFRGTIFLAGAMVAGAAALLAWDWHRLRGMLTTAPPVPTLPARSPIDRLGPAWERAAYAVGTAAGLAFFAFTRGVDDHGTVLGVVLLGGVAAFVALAGAARAVLADRRSRRRAAAANGVAAHRRPAR